MNHPQHCAPARLLPSGVNGIPMPEGGGCHPLSPQSEAANDAAGRARLRSRGATFSLVPPTLTDSSLLRASAVREARVSRLARSLDARSSRERNPSRSGTRSPATLGTCCGGTHAYSRSRSRCNSAVRCGWHGLCRGIRLMRPWMDVITVIMCKRNVYDGRWRKELEKQWDRGNERPRTRRLRGA